MAKYCPSCDGALVWGGEIADRRRAWCPSCGERFHRSAGWGEALVLGAMIYLVFKLLSGLIFDWMNPFGLTDDARDTASAITVLSGLGVAIVLAATLTRRGRQLRPADEELDGSGNAGQMRLSRGVLGAASVWSCIRRTSRRSAIEAIDRRDSAARTAASGRACRGHGWPRRFRSSSF